MPPEQQQPNPYGQQPQQNASGDYAVVPARPAIVNDGHSGHNPYEFIMNHNSAPKRSLWHGGSFAKRIALLVGGATVLIVVIAVVMSALTPKGSLPGMTTMAARQQELIRIASDATQDATGQDTLNFVANVEASMASDKLKTVAFVASHGGKVTPLALASARSTQADTLLENALSTNTYDTAVAQTLTEQLTSYRTLVNTTYKQSKNDKAKELLQTTYTNATNLLKQAQALPTSN